MSQENDELILLKMREQVSTMAAYIKAKTTLLDQKESQLKQSQISVENARTLEANMSRNMGPMLAPGNLGDINKIIWPYFFSTELPTDPIGPNQTFQTGFSVTQEASFIMMGFTKVVYQSEGDPATWTYLDPNQPAVGELAPGLTFTIRDGSSSRQFFDRPIQIGHYGNPRYPTKFPRPMMFMPNHVVQIAFQNAHPTSSYVPFITAWGYRMRVEDAQRFLSLVYA